MIQEHRNWGQRAYEDIGQWDNWMNLLDMCNAIRYGFSQYRLPKPGQTIDIQEAKNRVEHMDKEWEREYLTRGDKSQKSCPEFSKCPVDTQCYLHSILVSTGVVEEFYPPY